MKNIIVALLLALGCAACTWGADSKPQWQHGKKFPCEVLKVLSPTEYQIKLAEDGKTYSLRLAHVEDLNKKKKLKPEDWFDFMYHIKNGPKNPNGVMDFWLEFENDTPTKDKTAMSLVGYFFYTIKVSDTYFVRTGDYPLNTLVMAERTKDNKRLPLFKYAPEAAGDSKQKAVFEYFAAMK